jgi:hypothetical protein
MTLTVYGCILPVGYVCWVVGVRPQRGVTQLRKLYGQLALFNNYRTQIKRISSDGLECPSAKGNHTPDGQLCFESAGIKQTTHIQIYKKFFKIKNKVCFRKKQLVLSIFCSLGTTYGNEKRSRKMVLHYHKCNTCLCIGIDDS